MLLKVMTEHTGWIAHFPPYVNCSDCGLTLMDVMEGHPSVKR